VLKVTFLGSGAAVPAAGRTNIALVVESERYAPLLIECGPTILFQLTRAGISPERIRYLFLSHRHGDHTLGVPMLLLYRKMYNQGTSLTILAGQDALQTAQTLTDLVYPGILALPDHVEWHPLPEGETGHEELAPGLLLTTMPAPHVPDIPSLALRLDFLEEGRSLVYSADTGPSSNLVSLAAGCDLLIHEANFCETLMPEINPILYGHSTARTAGRTAAQAGCRLLALVHIHDAYGGREEVLAKEAATEFSGQVLVPQDGTVLYL